MNAEVESGGHLVTLTRAGRMVSGDCTCGWSFVSIGFLVSEAARHHVETVETTGAAS